MYKRKCNWCIFSDGHRERIKDHLHPYYSSEEIIFTTRSGTYKYHSLIGEVLEGVVKKDHILPKKYSQLSGTHFSKLTVTSELSVFYGIQYRQEYVPIHTIERIELID